jgi:2-amino-4-hydroxy-6-hydroxymethyldihydropteridine diphosphokinase
MPVQEGYMERIQAYISAGSNLGDRRAHLEFAISQLENAGAVLRVSPLFETEPVGYSDQPWFLNTAIEIATPLSPFELLHRCQAIETSRGRKRSFPNAPRTLDLDILFYGYAVIRDADLVIPHPRLTERKFVLEPMARIAPEFVHPTLKLPIRALLANCQDPSHVRLFNPEEAKTKNPAQKPSTI